MSKINNVLQGLNKMIVSSTIKVENVIEAVSRLNNEVASIIGSIGSIRSEIADIRKDIADIREEFSKTRRSPKNSSDAPSS